MRHLLFLISFSLCLFLKGQNLGAGISYTTSTDVKGPSFYIIAKLPYNQLISGGLALNIQKIDSLDFSPVSLHFYYSPFRIKNESWIYRLKLLQRLGTVSLLSGESSANSAGLHWLASATNSLGYKLGNTVVSLDFGIGNLYNAAENKHSICYTTGLTIEIMNRKQDKKREISIIPFQSP